MTSNPRLFVAGAGQMGHGIAQAAAASGSTVTLFDVDPAMLSSATEKIRWSLDKLHAKGRLAGSVEDVMSRLRTVSDLAQAGEFDAAIEAIPEREALKHDLFRRLEPMCGPGALLLTNTSAIPITRLARVLVHPERFCGMHFFAPVALMTLVEIVPGQATSQDTVEAAAALAGQLGKQPVIVRRDEAGFIVNRVLIAAAFEAMRLLERGVADAKTIDQAMQTGCGWKMGPLATCDMSGLDVILHAGQAIHDDCGDGKFLPPVILKRLVDAGQLGLKSGKGFYDYSSP